jgi:hypothetical protein
MVLLSVLAFEGGERVWERKSKARATNLGDATTLVTELHGNVVPLDVRLLLHVEYHGLEQVALAWCEVDHDDDGGCGFLLARWWTRLFDARSYVCGG